MGQGITSSVFGRRCILPILLTFLNGCAFFRESSPAEPQAERVPSGSHHGYALLYDLLGDEKDVSKLLIVKRERAELAALIKDISRVAADAHKTIEVLARLDRGLNLTDRGLPSAEMAARERIAKARAKELLTDKGKDFELRLLLTQNEALVYGTHLAAAVVAEEKNPDRVKFLNRLSGDLEQLQQRIVAMLTTNYSWTAPK